MPSFLETLLDALRNDPDEPTAEEPALQLATAALLIEMMRSDAKIDADEERTLRHSLRQEFDLDESALDTLIADAEAHARDAPGYYAFTRHINDAFALERKLRLMEYLWRVALADGHVAAHENHLMRKLADLIHVGHGDYHAAKERARDYHRARSRGA
jgi:uncharacterized tellurite resistance protein B-like protein